SADLPAKLAPPAPDSPKQGTATAEAVGKRVFEGACVHCHNWTGVSQISPFATIAGTRGVNDRTATNVVQIVISGTTRHTPTVSYRCRPSATPIPIPKLRRSPTM
ncbi:MAG TPA: hypothetical protein VHU22_02825, partial [Xanthobacteraceae bacterium]|nr:hypothetical protein [Xanthobacteraceae bacterium]